MGAAQEDDPFSHVRALEPHGPRAAEKLTALRDMLVRLGAPLDAERLLVVEKAAEERDFKLLDRFVTLGVPLHELGENRHGQVRRIVGWRNAAALLPLMITWMALAFASWDYQRMVQAHPKKITEPFLVLWQQRFDSVRPTFAETALVSFTLLFIVLILTMLAHRRESAANAEIAAATALADDALHDLGLTVVANDVRAPENAKEWAEAAQHVLTETQQLIKAALTDTTELAKRNNAIAQTASEQLGQLQVRAEELLKGVGKETREVMVALQRQSEQTTSRVGEEAIKVLQQAGEANRQLVEQQMTPLFTGFRESLADYRQDQEVYRASAAALAGGVTNLTSAAAGLASGVTSYTGIARAIDENLELIGTTQADLGKRIGTHSDGLAAATGELREVAELMAGDMRRDIEALTENVMKAGSTLVTAEESLASTGAALAATTRAIQAGASELASAAATVDRAADALARAFADAPPSRGFFARLFGRS